MEEIKCKRNNRIDVCFKNYYIFIKFELCVYSTRTHARARAYMYKFIHICIHVHMYTYVYVYTLTLLFLSHLISSINKS